MRGKGDHWRAARFCGLFCAQICRPRRMRTSSTMPRGSRSEDETSAMASMIAPRSRIEMRSARSSLQNALDAGGGNLRRDDLLDQGRHAPSAIPSAATALRTKERSSDMFVLITSVRWVEMTVAAFDHGIAAQLRFIPRQRSTQVAGRPKVGFQRVHGRADRPGRRQGP